MKKMFFALLLTVLCFFGGNITTLQAQHTLTIEIDNLENNNGEILLALYKGKTGFPEDDTKAFKLAKVKVENKKARVLLNDLPSGDYAFALFHDQNSNGKMDTNFMGIPKEGYAFSTNFKPKFSAPDFEQVNFELTGDTVQKIKLIN